MDVEAGTTSPLHCSHCTDRTRQEYALNGTQLIFVLFINRISKRDEPRRPQSALSSLSVEASLSSLSLDDVRLQPPKVSNTEA